MSLCHLTSYSYIIMCLCVCVCVWVSQPVCHAAELVASPGVFSQQGNTTDPNSNSGGQMAELVSRRAPYKGSEVADQPVRRQQTFKQATYLLLRKQHTRFPIHICFLQHHNSHKKIFLHSYIPMQWRCPRFFSS